MDNEQCKGCVYFKSSSGDPYTLKFCHYMYYTGKRRTRGENGICLSRKTKNFTLRKSFTIKKKFR